MTVLRLWDVETGRLTRRVPERLPEDGDWMAIRSLAFSPDGKVVATAGDNGVVQLWNPATGASLARWRGHEDMIESLAFSPSGKLLATASEDTTALLWDITSLLKQRP